MNPLKWLNVAWLGVGPFYTMQNGFLKKSCIFYFGTFFSKKHLRPFPNRLMNKVLKTPIKIECVVNPCRVNVFFTFHFISLYETSVKLTKMM